MSLKLLCPFVYLDRQMFSCVHFVHPSRPCSSRVFYVNHTPEQVFALHVCINRLCFAIVRIQEVFSLSLQAASVEKFGTAAAPAQYPFFALKEDKEPANEKADVAERADTEDGVVVAPIEITMRGVCTLWPHWLQRDTMNRYRLRGSLYRRLIDCYGHGVYSVFM